MKKKATKTKKRSTAKPKTPTVTALPTVDPDRAEAAAEVLENVFLHEKHFELENEIVREGGRPVATADAEGHVWVTVKLHVPALDIDCWLDGTHRDHPDNQPDDEDDA